MEGASRSVIGSRPNFACISYQPSTVPGTVHEWGVDDGMVPSASAGTLSAVRLAGERPDALRP